ncbi:MAG: FGGY-family carbohydrate kinase [Woeseia sp.]
MPELPVLVGIDIGTTAVKASAYTVEGQSLFSTARSYDPLPSEEPGWVEQDPRSWMLAIESVAEEVRCRLPRSRYVGVGLTSQVNTHIFVDSAGVALLPAITWQDQRCAVSSEIVNGMIDSHIRSSLRGSYWQVDASSLISRAHWIKTFQPNIWEKTEYVFSPKDYCLFQLTGVPAADAISSIGLVDGKGEYLHPLVALIDGLQERLPPIRAVTDIIGETTDDFPFGSCPLNVGIMDAWACLYGSGAVHHGDTYQVAGTSEVIGVHSDRAFPSAGVVTFPPIPGWYLHAGPTQLGGDAAMWMAGLLGVDTGRIFELAADAKNLREPLVFLPHLMGERAPFWDAKSKGVFAGLTRKHTQNDLAHAVLEGVAYAARALIDCLEIAAGLSIDSIRISGGGSRSDLWCQIKADVMNRRFLRLRNIDTGTFGAAILAGVSQNIYTDVVEATATAVQVEREFTPRPAHRIRCDFAFERYLETYHALKATSHKLHDFAAAQCAGTAI